MHSPRPRTAPDLPPPSPAAGRAWGAAPDRLAPPRTASHRLAPPRTASHGRDPPPMPTRLRPADAALRRESTPPAGTSGSRRSAERRLNSFGRGGYQRRCGDLHSMCSTRSLTMWPSCSPCTFRCMLAYKIWLFPAVVMAGSAICQMPSKAAEPPEELVGRRFVAPSHGFTSKPPLDASLPYGEGYTAADSDGRRYVTMMRLRGTRPLANDASVAYRLTYHNLPAGAVVPIGDRLWQVFEAAPGGVARSAPWL